MSADREQNHLDVMTDMVDTHYSPGQYRETDEQVREYEASERVRECERRVEEHARGVSDGDADGGQMRRKGKRFMLRYRRHDLEHNVLVAVSRWVRGRGNADASVGRRAASDLADARVEE